MSHDTPVCNKAVPQMPDWEDRISKFKIWRERERERVWSVSGNMKGFYRQKKNTTNISSSKSSNNKPPIHAPNFGSHVSQQPPLQGLFSSLLYSLHSFPRVLYFHSFFVF